MTSPRFLIYGGMVGTERFELSTSCSRSKRSTRLSYVPSFHPPEGPEER